MSDSDLSFCSTPGHGYYEGIVCPLCSGGTKSIAPALNKEVFVRTVTDAQPKRDQSRWAPRPQRAHANQPDDRDLRIEELNLTIRKLKGTNARLRSTIRDLQAELVLRDHTIIALKEKLKNARDTN